MKYLFLICLSLTIYSCKNAEEPIETFDKSWLLGEWTFLGSSAPHNSVGFCYFILNNKYIGDTLYLEDAVLIKYTSSQGALFNCKFRSEIISINQDSNFVEIKSDNYPIGNKIKSNPVEYNTIPIKAKYYFEGKNKMTMKVIGAYIDSFSQMQVTNWESKYERKTK